MQVVIQKIPENLQKFEILAVKGKQPSRSLRQMVGSVRRAEALEALVLGIAAEAYAASKLEAEQGAEPDALRKNIKKGD